MLISHLFTRHKSLKPKFAPGLFVGLLGSFVVLGQTKPIVGLTGIGTTLIVTGVLIELNRRTIWDNYRKTFHKQKGLAGLWTKPNEFYYTINVQFLWPLIIFLGVVCLWAAYALA